MAPRKVRAVIDLVRGKQADEALRVLSLTNKLASTPVKKLIDSAIANATNNFKLDRSTLTIAQIYANEGPTLKRWMPRAFGRATTIRQRSCHVHIVLDDQPVQAAVDHQPVKRAVVKPATKQATAKPAAKPPASVTA